MNDKLSLIFVPVQIMKENNIAIHVRDLGLIINADNWPDNLIYNPKLITSDDLFYEELCCDSTLYFYVQSAIRRCKSLVSRATHNPSVIWEHGPIRVFGCEGDCPKPWMIRTRTEVAIRRLNDNQ